MSGETLSNPSQLPIIKTTQVLRGVDGIMEWLDPKHREPFLLIGPDGCGKKPEKLSSCKAKLNNGSIIDLTSLDNPKHPRQIKINGYSLSFNPCKQLFLFEILNKYKK